MDSTGDWKKKFMYVRTVQCIIAYSCTKYVEVTEERSVVSDIRWEYQSIEEQPLLAAPPADSRELCSPWPGPLSLCLSIVQRLSGRFRVI